MASTSRCDNFAVSGAAAHGAPSADVAGGLVRYILRNLGEGLTAKHETCCRSTCVPGARVYVWKEETKSLPQDGSPKASCTTAGALRGPSVEGLWAYLQPASHRFFYRFFFRFTLRLSCVSLVPTPVRPCAGGFPALPGYIYRSFIRMWCNK